jgi:hypothetical protein
MLCEQPAPSDEAMPSVEIEDEPEDIAVHLVDMLNSESPKIRNTWLQRLDGSDLAQLLQPTELENALNDSVLPGYHITVRAARWKQESCPQKYTTAYRNGRCSKWLPGF